MSDEAKAKTKVIPKPLNLKLNPVTDSAAKNKLNLAPLKDKSQISTTTAKSPKQANHIKSVSNSFHVQQTDDEKQSLTNDNGSRSITQDGQPMSAVEKARARLAQTKAKKQQQQQNTKHEQGTNQNQPTQSIKSLKLQPPTANISQLVSRGKQSLDEKVRQQQLTENKKKAVQLSETNIPEEKRRLQQEYWMYCDVKNAFVPNNSVDYSQKLCQAYVKISLLRKQENGSFAALQKSNQQTLTTIQHETTTNIQSQQSGQLQDILAITTQPQQICGNSEFFSHFQPLNVDPTQIDTSKQARERLNLDYFLLDVEDFPMGNSAIVKFGNERMIFNDQEQNLLNCYIFIQLIQLPTWQHPNEQVLGWGCIGVGETMRRKNTKLCLKLFQPLKDTSIGVAKYYDVLQKIYQKRPFAGDVSQLDIESATDLQIAFLNTKIYQPKQIGVLQFRYGFLTGEQIVQERYVRQVPIYPYDIEVNAYEQEETQEQKQQQQQFVDLSQYINVKPILDNLHQLSISFSKEQKDKSIQTFNTMNMNCSLLQSNSISSIAACPQGNIALGAAAVLCDSDAYSIVLFNIGTGENICVLGTHFGYVYQIQFSQDGRFLYSCSADGTVFIFDV